MLTTASQPRDDPQLADDLFTKLALAIAAGWLTACCANLHVSFGPTDWNGGLHDSKTCSLTGMATLSIAVGPLARPM